MNRWIKPIAAALCVLGGAVPCAAQKWEYDRGLRFRSPNFELAIDNRVQVRFTLEDPDPGSAKGSFDVARYKLKLTGRVFDQWHFGIQGNLAGGSETSEELLEDAYLRFDRNHMAQLWVGQGKVLFGRQAMTSSGKLQFVDRSIASERFTHGRDVGIAVIGENARGTYGYSAGIYNGNGINKDEGDNVDYMGVVRLCVTPFGEYHPDEPEIYRLDETDLERHDDPYLAVGVAALTNTIGTEDVEETRVTRGVLEVAYKIRGFNLQAEFFTESADLLLLEGQNPEPDPDEEDTDGWHIQAGYLLERTPVEIAARYSEILRDDANTDTTEAGVAVGYYVRSRHDYKVQADYRRLRFEANTGEETIDRDEFRIQLQLVF